MPLLLDRHAQQKPPLGAQLNRAHPLAQSLEAIYLLNEGSGASFFDLVAGAVGSKPSLISWGTSAGGGGLFTTASHPTAILPNLSFFSGTSPITAEVWFSALAVGNTGSIFGMGTPSAGRGFSVKVVSNTSLNYYTWYNDQAITVPALGTALHQVVYAYDNAINKLVCYLDGRFLASATPSSTINFANSANANVLFGWEVNAGNCNFAISRAAYWSRALSAAEAAQLYAEPYAMVQQRNHQRWFLAAGGGTTYNQAMSGLLTPAGSIARQTSKSLPLATITAAGAVSRATSKSLPSGTITQAGAVSRQTAKSVAGTLTQSGAVTRRLSKALVGGTLTLAGTLTTARVRVVALVGATLTHSGTIARQATKALGGTITHSGSISRRTAKALGGTLTLAGAVTRLSSKAVGGTLAQSGSIARQTAKGLIGATLTIAGFLSSVYSATARIYPGRSVGRDGQVNAGTGSDMQVNAGTGRDGTTG